jgi:hypothetical protein
MPIMDWCGKQTDWYKECSKCKTGFWVEADSYEAAWDLMLEHFSKHGHGSRDGFVSQCRSCMTAQWHGRENRLHRDEMLEAQGGKCGICERPLVFDLRADKANRGNVDHDHKTGMDRGIVCTGCNIGMTYVDRDDWLEKAIAYRDKHRATSTISLDQTSIIQGNMQSAE